jgi:hypothetical protein
VTPGRQERASPSTPFSRRGFGWQRRRHWASEGWAARLRPRAGSRTPTCQFVRHRLPQKALLCTGIRGRLICVARDPFEAQSVYATPVALYRRADLGRTGLVAPDQAIRRGPANE